MKLSFMLGMILLSIAALSQPSLKPKNAISNFIVTPLQVADQQNRQSTLTCNNWLNTPTQPSYVDIGNLNITGDKITIEAVFNRTSFFSNGVNTEGDLVSKHQTPSDANYILRPTRGLIKTNTGFYQTPDVCGIQLNKTYHVAMVYDGAILKFYRNGFLMSQIAATGNLVQNNWRTYIAYLNPQDQSENFIGYINEVRIWNIARTQNEIRTYMNGSLPSPITQTGLLAYYTFDNLLNKQGNATWNGTLGGNANINTVNPNCNFIADSCAINVIQAGFTIPDTVCVNTPVNIVNTSTGATSYSWNFCVADLNAAPQAINMGNVGNILSQPAFLDFVLDNGNYYGFSTNHYPGKLVRLNFGTSLLNTPTVTDLGNFGGILPAGYGSEGIQVVKNEGKWYIIIVGGSPNNGSTPKIIKIELGISIINNSPIATDWGNIGNLAQPIDLMLFQENSIWYGLTVNAENNTVTRFNFSNTFNNTPIGLNLGNLGGLNYPTGLHAVYDNGVWRAFIANGAYNTGNPVPSITRLDFGNSLLNAPTAVNLGNVGGLLNQPRDITVLTTCGQAFGYVVNGTTNTITKLNFNNNLQSVPIATSLGNIGNLNFPHSISKLFRSGPDLYAFITNINNNTITRLKFTGCNNSSIPSSNLQNPPQVMYNASGTYNINLAIDEGLSTQVVICKQINVLPEPSVTTRADTTICKGTSVQLNTTSSNATSYAWSPNIGLSSAFIAAPVASPLVTTTYIVTASNRFCQKSDTVIVNVNVNIDSVRIKDSLYNCNAIDFKGIGYIHSVPIIFWQWTFGDGGTATTQNTVHQYSSTGNYLVKLVVTDANGCKDSISKTVNTLGANSSDFSFHLNPCNPLSVQFISNAPVPLNNYWSFGDGGSLSNTQSPAHLFMALGSYIIRYTNPSGNCLDTITKVITIGSAYQNLILTNDTTICFASPKQLLTVPSNQFCWSPSAYLNNPLLANPITSTPQNTIYYFTSLVTGSNLIQNGNFSQGNSGFTSAYTFTSSNSASGQYNISANASSWLGTSLICNTDHTTGTGNMLMANGSATANTSIWSQTIAVTPNTNYELSGWLAGLNVQNPAVIHFTINGIKLGSPATAASTTCQWNRFSAIWNSGTQTTINLSLININAQAIGNDFALDDLAFAPVFIRRDSVIINVDTPVVHAGNDTTICRNDTLRLQASGAATYTWLPASSLSNAGINNPFAFPTATTQYIVSGYTINGCVAVDTINVQVKLQPVITSFTNDTTICRNTSVQLNAGGGISYVWQPANSLSNPLLPNPIASPTTSITYFVTVTGSNGCNARDSVKLTTKPTPLFKVDPLANTCFGNQVQLHAYGGNSYLWSPSAGLSANNIDNPFAGPATNTTYAVIIRESNCNDSALLSVVVNVLPLPVLNVNKSNDIDCSVGLARLAANGANTYRWGPGNSLSDSTTANPLAMPSITTTYTVSGRNFNGCENKDSVTVLVKFDGNGLHYLPNAFTPNGDGLNECFGVQNWGSVTNLNFAIYNRWGERVFYTTNPNICWDGRYKNELQQSGNFVYIVQAKTPCGVVDMKGSVLLVR